MKCYKILCVLFAATLVAEAEDSKSLDSGPHYLFMSGKISAQLKDSFLPVKAFDGKRFHLRGSDKTILIELPKLGHLKS